MGERIKTNVKARNGDPIYVGDIVETVQGTKFEVIYLIGTFKIRDKDGNVFDFEPFMSPNLWIIGQVETPAIF